MAAYSAVVSLGQLLQQLLDSDQLPELQPFHETIRSLQTSVKRIFPAPKSERATANSLQIELRELIYEAQDAVESFISGKSASLPLLEFAANLDPIATTAKNLADSIRPSIEALLDGDGDIPPPPKLTLTGRSNRIVGQERDNELVTQELMNDEDKLQVLPISGMPGIGKTTLARSIYDDRKMKDTFIFRAWVTVSQDYNVRDIVERLLNSMESRSQKAGEKVIEGSDEQLRVQLHQSLYNNKYLIVIDDMWDIDIWDRVKNLLPDNKNGSRIILTTRISRLAKTVKSSNFCHEMQPLDEENSWILLCEKAFGGMLCPPQLEKVGIQIANNCNGLPLSLSVIGGLLSQEAKTEEYWQSIEEDTNAAAAKGEGAYLEILLLSYSHLPGELKGCFLYMGAFPEDSDIPISKLSKLWVAEGFLLPPPRPRRLEEVAEEHLTDLTLKSHHNTQEWLGWTDKNLRPA